jgi:glycosyltransferase involved in cell wall biosynthesis
VTLVGRSTSNECSTFSIAMATYNGERHLREQLRSLAEQTLPPNELVICDDASTDSTADIVRLFAPTAPFPVRFIRNEQRLGYRGNFMKAAGLCTSDYVAFCDQDDVWLAEKLALARKYIDQTGCTLFQHGYRWIDGHGDVLPGERDREALDRAGPWGISPGMSQIFRRSMLSFAPLREMSVDQCVGTGVMSHDQWTLFISSLMGEVVTVKDVLVLKRLHNDNVFLWPTTRSNLSTFGIIVECCRGKPEAYREKRAYLMTMAGRMAAGARSRVAIIESLKKVSPSEKLAVLQENIEYYKKNANYNEDRLAVYTIGSKLKRLSKVISMYFDRSYQAFGTRGVMDSGLDVLYGVLSTERPEAASGPLGLRSGGGSA